jgi:hypothetical protein
VEDSRSVDTSVEMTLSIREGAFVRRCVTAAVEAIVQLWDSDHKTFWRSTVHKAREAGKQSAAFFPTVTFRCVDALLCLASKQPDWIDPAALKILVEECIPAVVSHGTANLRSTLNAPGEGPQLNIFTLSLYVQVFARICKSKSISGESATIAAKKLQPAATQLLKHTALRIGTDASSFGPHPFLLFHASRSLAEGLPLLKNNAHQRASDVLLQSASNARESIEKLIAKHRLGLINPGESIALAFCAATLATCGSADDKEYILEAFKTCFEAQDSSGCWPLGRVVREDKDIASDRLEIPTYEVAAVLEEALTELLEKTEEPFSSVSGIHAVEKFIQAARYTERSMVRLSDGTLPRMGWCSDHAYGKQIIESWTSASVLQSLLGLHALMEEIDRESIL